MTQEDIKIENCPMCGPKVALVQWTTFRRDAESGSDLTERAQVRCVECDARGPHVGAATPEAAARHAIGLWNSRVRYCEPQMKELQEQTDRLRKQLTERCLRADERIDNQARTLMARDKELKELTERCQRAELERGALQLDFQHQRHAASLQESLKNSAQRQLTSTVRELVETRAHLREANDDIVELREQLEASWSPLSVVGVAVVVGLVVAAFARMYA